MTILVAACGGDDGGLLPGDDAEEIIANLERVEQLATDGDCDAAEAAIDEVASQVESLPEVVSDSLQGNLMSGIDRLREVVAENCPDHEIEADEEPETEQPVEPDDADNGASEDADDDRPRGRPDRDRDTTPGRDRPTPQPGRPDPGDDGGDQPPPTPRPPAPDDTGGVTPGVDADPTEGPQ